MNLLHPSRAKSVVPWWLKIGAKLVLSRLPVSYRQLASAGLIRHGRMNDGGYALGVFRTHFPAAPIGVWTGLEIGPGDSVFSAVLAKYYGCREFWLVDQADFADKAMKTYRQMAASLERAEGMEGLAQICTAPDFETLLRRCNAGYLTRGVASLAQIESESLDYIGSHAVLEHIRAADFPRLCRETYRILRPGGRASHIVDFKDHLQNGSNNLRFSSALWEQEWFAQRSMFYTNRLRFSAMRRLFAGAGFTTRILYRERWPASPLPKRKLAPEFRELDDEDLLISGCHFLLEKPSSPIP